ncbi:MAG: hypothetical protein CMB78_05165 [Euryarchaeota archaeon]|nr:hypothetical protein [Euryarchaeota archaeon]
MNKKALTLSICLLLATSMAPSSIAEGQEDSAIWGVTYDWSHFEGDALNMTGVDVNELNRDLKEAATFAGFDLDYDQVLSGNSQFFVETWEEAGPFTVSDEEGTSYNVSKRVTELTIRHGSMADTGVVSNWSHNDEMIDVWASAYQDYLVVLNANYVEYVDSDLVVYGADLHLDGEFSISMGFDFELGVSAANETISPDISSSASLSFIVPNITSNWKVNEPVDYHFLMSSEPTEESANSSGADFDPDQGAIGKGFENTGYIDGTYSSETSYALGLSASGIPAEDFDVDIDVFNVALSDTIVDQGIFFQEMPLFAGAVWGHDCPPVMGKETIVVDGTQFQAQCGLVPPVPWGMGAMLALSLAEAFDSGVEQLGEVAIGQAEEWLGEAGLEFEDGDDIDDIFVCANGNQIPGYWVNDGYDDCGDNSDEVVIRDSVWHCVVNVNLDSLEDYNSSSFRSKVSDHPGFPEWCGEEVPENLSLKDTQPNLPPPEVPFGSYHENANFYNARNETHYFASGHPNCGDSGSHWSEAYELCAIPIQGSFAADADHMYEDCCGWSRYHWTGDYLYIGLPAPEYFDAVDLSYEFGQAQTDFLCDDGYYIPSYFVDDGEEDCYDGSDEGSSDDGILDKYERMAEELEASNLEKTMEAFSERLEALMEDNFPDEPLYELEDLCATMLWSPSEMRVFGMAIVLEGRILLGPSITNVNSHPITMINAEFLSGQAAKDAKSGTESQVDLDDMAPESMHDVQELYEILGLEFFPDLDQTDTDKDGTTDFFDSDDDNDGVSDWEGPEPAEFWEDSEPAESPGDEEASSSGLPSPGVVAVLSVITAAAIAIPRREH